MSCVNWKGFTNRSKSEALLVLACGLNVYAYWSYCSLHKMQ